MNTAFEIVDFLMSVLIFLALVPALWISGRIILRNAIAEARYTRLFLWLVLGGFFLIPLTDLIAYLGQWILLAVPSDQGTTPVFLFLGSTTWLSYSILFTVTGLIIYAVGIYYGRKVIAEGRLPVIKDLSLDALEQNFMVLGLAGLFSTMVRGVLLNFLSIRFPAASGLPSLGLTGSLVGWILALIVLALVLIFMDGKLKSREE